MIYDIIGGNIEKFGGLDVFNKKTFNQSLSEFADKDENDALATFIDSQTQFAFKVHQSRISDANPDSLLNCQQLFKSSVEVVKNQILTDCLPQKIEKNDCNDGYLTKPDSQKSSESIFDSEDEKKCKKNTF